MTAIVDFIIFDERTKSVLIQQRSDRRSLFPGRWELPGGHVDDGETHEECIRRELAEECDMRLLEVVARLHTFRWPDDPTVENYIYLVRAAGTLRPELGKVASVKWITQEDVESLRDLERSSAELAHSVREAFALMSGRQ